MKKPVKNVTNCQHCDKQIDLASPPARKYYEEGQISISGGTILLAKPTKKDGNAADLEGLYCDIGCLISYLKHLRS